MTFPASGSLCSLKPVRLLWPVFFVCLLLGVACSSSRRPVSTEPALSQAEVPPVEEPQPQPDEETETVQRVDETVAFIEQDAKLLFARGRELFAEGEIEKARYYFEESLAMLRNSGPDWEEYPRLEALHESLASAIRRVEILALAPSEHASDEILHELDQEISPLDEIADLDLYTIEVDPELEDLVYEDVKNTHFDFPVVVNEQVVKFLDYYQGRGRKTTEAALKRSGRYIEKFKEIFAEEGLPRDLVFMAHVESLFKPKAYSRAHARGIWQFVSGTARLYDLKIDWWLDERLDVLRATRAAARHLKDLKEEFGDWYLALAAYNGGPGRVSRAIRRHGKLDYWEMTRRRLLPRETRNYVPSILAALIIYRHPDLYGFSTEIEPAVEFEELQLEFQVDLKVVADALDVKVELVEELNPELLRGVTPVDLKDYRLKVPPGKGEKLLLELAEIPPEERLRLAHHKVRRGETLSHIAGRYGTSIRAIAEMNRIRNVNRLSLGQDLVIPLSDWKAVKASGTGPVSGDGKYTVRRGDSLYKIAVHHGLRVTDLVRWNNLVPNQVIHPGQQIFLREAPGEIAEETREE